MRSIDDRAFARRSCTAGEEAGHLIESLVSRRVVRAGDVRARRGFIHVSFRTEESTMIIKTKVRAGRVCGQRNIEPV